MTREIAGVCPRTWKHVPKTWDQAKKGHDCISRWLVKLVEGKLGADHMHSTCGEEAQDSQLDLVRLITFGPFCRKFCFRIWGREGSRSWPSLSLNHGARLRYTEMWNGESTMVVPFAQVLKDNGPIRVLAASFRSSAPKFGMKLGADLQITSEVGDLKVSIRLGRDRL
jgi:hypothetical protein